jgi:ABC-2 type transport system ATP-binding protein
VLHRPPVLFLDEPTTGLDLESRLALWESIRGLVRDGTTVLLTTQYLDEADVLAGQVVIIDSGRAVDTGTPAQLKSRFGAVVVMLGFEAEADAAGAAQQLTSTGYQADRTGLSVRIHSTSGSGIVPHILRALSASPTGQLAVQIADPVSVAVHEPTLDDVFLALTGRVPQTQPDPPARGGKAA